LKNNKKHKMDSKPYLKSLKNLELVQEINLFFSLFIILAGLIGHYLTIFVFAQSRFRKNSTNVYLLCLAINNSIYLKIHLVEDIFKTIKFLYNIDILIIVDYRYINYSKYVLRFVSAYSIVVFILQRLKLVYQPMSTRFRSKKSAWKSMFLIVFISLILNVWILFNPQFGDLAFNIISVSMIIIVPILIIILSNCLIIFSLFKDSNQRLRKHFGSGGAGGGQVDRSRINNQTPIKMKAFYLNFDQYLNRITVRANSTIKLTIIIVSTSISYVLMNLPYLIVWFLIVNKKNNYEENLITKNHNYYSMLKLAEIVYLINFSINFYIYCASGSVFRKQLRYSCKYRFFLLIY